MKPTSASFKFPINPPYSACAVADLLLQEALAQGINDMTNVKINRLVYIAHGWRLGLHGTPLVEESIEAWNRGPVISSLYYWVKYKCDASPSSKITDEDAFVQHRVNATEGVRHLIKKIVGLYGRKSTGELTRLTHKQGSPWEKVTARDMGSIPDDLIQEYYGERMHS